VRKTSERDLNVSLAEEVREKKNVTGTIKVFPKTMIDFRKIKKETRGYPYILCYEMEGVSLFNTRFVYGREEKLFRLYFT